MPFHHFIWDFRVNTCKSYKRRDSDSLEIGITYSYFAFHQNKLIKTIKRQWIVRWMHSDKEEWMNENECFIHPHVLRPLYPFNSKPDCKQWTLILVLVLYCNSCDMINHACHYWKRIIWNIHFVPLSHFPCSPPGLVTCGSALLSIGVARQSDALCNGSSSSFVHAVWQFIAKDPEYKH